METLVWPRVAPGAVTYPPGTGDKPRQKGTWKNQMGVAAPAPRPQLCIALPGQGLELAEAGQETGKIHMENKTRREEDTLPGKEQLQALHILGKTATGRDGQPGDQRGQQTHTLQGQHYANLRLLVGTSGKMITASSGPLGGDNSAPRHQLHGKHAMTGL